jgi:hypothetical protein
MQWTGESEHEKKATKLPTLQLCGRHREEETIIILYSCRIEEKWMIFFETKELH